MKRNKKISGEGALQRTSGWAVLLGGLLPILAGAQVPDAGGLLQTVPPLRVAPSLAPEIESRIQKARPIADVEGLQIDIKGFRILGLTTLPAEQAQAAVAPYVGSGKRFQDLVDASAALKKLLAGRGLFLADVIVPEQKIKDGIVELLVLEGRLGKVKVDMADDVGISRQYIESYLAALQPGGIIETTAVERVLFLLSDLKGVNIFSTFEPGEKIGSADLVVKVTPTKRVDANIDFDANGSIYTGVYRGGLGLDIGNLAGLGDLFSMRHMRSVEGNGFDYSRLTYLSPIGSQGWKLGAAVSGLNYSLGTSVFEPLRARGTADVQSLIVAYPFFRSRNFNLIATGQFDYRVFKDRQEAAARYTEKKIDAQSISLGGDTRDALWGGGINVFNATVTGGSLKFPDPALLAADRNGRNTSGDYTKSNLSFSRLQTVNQGTALYFSYSQQFAAGKNLDSVEKFSLGGPAAVRAYPQGEGTGDEGTVLTAEMRFRVPLTDPTPGNMVFAVFYDIGWSKLNMNMLSTDTTNKREISGVGIGVNWEVARNFALRASLARPADKSTAEHDNRDPRLYLQLSKYF